MGKYDRIDLDVQVLAETETTVKVAVEGTRRSAWLPKSLVAIDDRRTDGRATLSITEALATAKGLV